jgi:hypothetical protein
VHTLKRKLVICIHILSSRDGFNVKKNVFVALTWSLWLVFLIVVRVISGVSLELLFILGLIGLLVIFLYSGVLYARPVFYPQLRYLAIAAFIAFFFIMGSRFVSGLQHEYFFSSFFTLEAWIPAPYQDAATAFTAFTGSANLVSAVATIAGLGLALITVPVLIRGGIQSEHFVARQFMKLHYGFDQEKREKIILLNPSKRIIYAPSSRNGPVDLMIFPRGSIDPRAFPQFSLRPDNTLSTTPSGAFLLKALEDSQSVTVPGNKEELFRCIEQLYCYTLEVASSAHVREIKNAFRLEIGNLEPPSLYTTNLEFFLHPEIRYPGALCSLFACIVAKGLQAPVAIDTISVENGLSVTISLLGSAR